MLARAKQKLDMDGKVIQAGRFDNQSSAAESEAVLRMMLEADNEEVNEDTVMDDDEINQIIARTDEELERFKSMDYDRDVNEEREWREMGNRGSKPERMMTFAELPEVYQRDEPYEPPESDMKATGRGARERKAVIYNDGLTDDQWVTVSVCCLFRKITVLIYSVFRLWRKPRTWMTTMICLPGEVALPAVWAVKDQVDPSHPRLKKRISAERKPRAKDAPMIFLGSANAARLNHPNPRPRKKTTIRVRR
jgi:hypothetical protein